MSIKCTIEEKIHQMKLGSVFTIKDFSVYGKYDTVKKVLLRLENSGDIVRIMDGLYAVPQYSKLTKEYLPPAINDVALFIAKKNGWSVVPTGETCLNALGLSTQMPALYEFISDGPYRQYEIYGFTISFKHTTNREITNFSYKSAMIVQALKSIGKENINGKVIQIIRDDLSEAEKIDLLHESEKVTAWVYEFIKEIAKPA